MGFCGRKSSSGRLTLYLEQKFKNQSLKITIVVFPYLSVREARKKAIELKKLMANKINLREVKRQQQIEENEERLKARQDITFKQLMISMKSTAKYIIQTGMGVLKEYIIMGNCYF